MAVNRRQKENDTFSDIAHTLPIEENAKELDKASILRIAIHYLRLRDILADCEPESLGEDFDLGENNSDSSALPNYSKDVLQALDGFMLLVSKEGKVLFASESIAQYLGLRQVDVIGIDLQDIIHPQDFMDVAAIFQSQGHDVGPEIEALGNSSHLRRNFVVRMRCAFTPSVRSVTRCSNFKPIYCSAFLKFSSKKVKEGEFLGMTAFCKLASVMKVKELCVGAYFKTKHSLDLSYTAIDTRIRWILGFDPAKMVGCKAYDYFHPQDLLATSSCHTNLLTQGHSHSPCYRFMAQSGDWVWVRSKSCVTYDPVTHHPNGLSIYTWIVRYDEEDDRMKALVEGKDPTYIGVKDVSQMNPPPNMNIKTLCDPSSSKLVNDLVNPLPMSSDVPSTHSPPRPQSCSVSSPQSHTSSFSPNVTQSPSNQISPSPIKVSPEISSVPPNVNPFQTRSDGSPVSSSGSGSSSLNSSPHNGHSYDISSPKTATAFVGDPFMGANVSSSSTTTNIGYSDQKPPATTTTRPSHYKLGYISQSSIDSQKESSPPYTMTSVATVYNYSSTPSPDASVGLGLSPGMDSSPTSSAVHYQQQHQTFADIQASFNSNSLQHSPQYGGHPSPYSSYGNSSPYSVDSCNGSSSSSFVHSPPHSQVGSDMTGSFAVEATMYLPAPQSYMSSMEPPMMAQGMPPPIGQDYRYIAQNIKQESFSSFDNHCSYNQPPLSTPILQPVTGFHKMESYSSQAKARYTSVAVAGKKFQHSSSHSKRPTQEDAAILGISQWLQQGSTPVH